MAMCVGGFEIGFRQESNDTITVFIILKGIHDNYYHQSGDNFNN